jgi:hypothetical protein
MLRQAASGPDLPFGRSAMSTRKVKPSSVISEIAAISFFPSRMKNSWFDSERWPGPGLGIAVFRVHEDQVDVRRHVELAAAVLAHRQHHHLLGPAGFLADRHAVGGSHLGHELGQVGLHGEVGEAAHRRDDLIEIGLAVEVAFDNGADQKIAQPAHGPHQRQLPAIRAGAGLSFQCRAEIEG